MQKTYSPNTEVIEKWAALLESGEFSQARNALSRVSAPEEDVPTDPANRTVGHCCLGVLCELAVREGIIGRPEQYGDSLSANGVALSYAGAESFLPMKVVEWAGLASHNPRVYLSEEFGDGDVHTEQHTLADLNDIQVMSFKEIARVVREQWLAKPDASKPA